MQPPIGVSVHVREDDMSGRDTVFSQEIKLLLPHSSHFGMRENGRTGLQVSQGSRFEGGRRRGGEPLIVRGDFNDAGSRRSGFAKRAFERIRVHASVNFFGEKLSDFGGGKPVAPMRIKIIT